MLDRNASEWHPINAIVNEKVSVRAVKKGQENFRSHEDRSSLSARRQGERNRNHAETLAGCHFRGFVH